MPAAPKSRRGGKRPGAGRPKKGQLPPSQIAELDVRAALNSPPPDEIEIAARGDLDANLVALVKQLMHGASEAAKISAAKEILDQGYGKPAVEIGGDAAPMLPFMQAPAEAAGVAAEKRNAARRYANLAILVLRKIRDGGQSESARVSAAKALNERAIGKVAPARMLEEMTDRPLGKKEEAAQAAKLAGTGRFATPPPPRFARPETVQ